MQTLHLQPGQGIIISTRRADRDVPVVDVAVTRNGTVRIKNIGPPNTDELAWPPTFGPPVVTCSIPWALRPEDEPVLTIVEINRHRRVFKFNVHDGYEHGGIISATTLFPEE